MKTHWFVRAGLAVLALSGVGAMRAQYAGHIDTDKKSVTATLRSVAVLEWTGDRNRPSATRLVPVSLFDGVHLQDGGLYLARPVPLALDSGTEYELESSGLPQGWFDLDGARQIGDDWFGFGDWKPYVPPAPKKLHPSRNPPTVVQEKPSDDRPHFTRRDQTSTGTSGTGSSTSGTSGRADGTSQPAAAPVDPDRPRLRRRPADDAATMPQPSHAMETPSAASDPDRPHLSHGKPADLKDQPKPLELTPVSLGQIVAVSDAADVGHETFAYDWNSPADAANVQKELEAQAEALLAATPASSTPPAAAPTAAKTSAPAKTSATARTTAHSRATSRKHVAKAAASPLTDVHFSAFALTYGGGATLVLTAREAASTRSIAVIGMEDIYGKVQMLWHSITDDTHLDVTPRTTLVDAVDPRGDGRANLLFEQRNATDRRFVLYAVGATNAAEVFATDPLPLHPVVQPPPSE